MAVFNISDFEFVNLPVPAGYDYGQTHCGISFVSGGFGGYTHWMCASPYPNYDVSKENPCVYFANVRGDGRPPISFNVHPNNPLMLQPPPNVYTSNPYNSDPDIFFDSVANKMFVLNRSVTVVDPANLAKDSTNIIYSMEVTPTTSSSPNILMTKYEVVTGNEMLSPALSKVGSNYRIQLLESSGGSVNVRCRGVITMESPTMDRNFKNVRKGSIFSKGRIESWHWDTFIHNSKTYAIVCATDWSSPLASKPLKLYLAESQNGFDYSIYPTPLIDVDSYRGSAYVDASGNLVLYASIVSPENKVYSVDGREIVLVMKNFNEVLSLVQ